MRFSHPLACLALALAGCAAGTVTTTVASNLTSATQVQVTTLGDAITTADTVTKAADIYLRSPTTTRAQAQAVLNGLTALHSQIAKLNADRVAGRSLVFDTYNLILKSFSAIKL